MHHLIRFTKVSGAGNDFVLINNMDGALTADTSQLAIALCSRRFGVGADGLLLLEPSSKADFFMRYYNADGSYGGMCGNGGRCVVRYAFVHGVAGKTMTFEALDHVYAARVEGETVALQLKSPRGIRRIECLQAEQDVYTGYFVNTGSPHLVLPIADLSGIPVETHGRILRNDNAFAPAGTNVDFVQRVDPGRLEIRTYERGVEAETLACGTGAVAAALIASTEWGIPSPIQIRVRSGEVLLVKFKRTGGDFAEVFLEGSAHLLFGGILKYDDSTGRIADYTEIMDVRTRLQVS